MRKKFIHMEWHIPFGKDGKPLPTGDGMQYPIEALFDPQSKRTILSGDLHIEVLLEIYSN